MQRTNTVLAGLTAAICLLISGCRDSARNYPVTFVQRREVSSVERTDENPNRLALVLEITDGGRLSLNKIETGTIADLTQLSEKLEAIFDDRDKAGIRVREVLIDPRGEISGAELDGLLDTLNRARASPILVIKDAPD